MTIAEQIKKALWDEYNNGGKQQEMARKHHVTQQYISRLLSGKRSCEGLSLKAVSKMFPYATLNIHGDSVIADNSGINNGVMGVNNGTVNPASHESVEAFRHKIQDEIIRADVDPEAKVKILNIILNAEVK